MGKTQLLLIDNSEQDALRIAEYLDESEIFDFEITHLLSLKESYCFLENNSPDIILVNLCLEDSYGIHTFDQLFHDFPRIPFLILTDINDHSIAMNAVKKGAQDFLVKNKIDADLLTRSITYSIERKKTEEELRQSEEKYKALFERSKDAIYFSSSEGYFIDINPAGLALFGYQKEDLADLEVKDLYISIDDRKKLKETLEKNGQINDYEVSLKKKDNKTVLDCLVNSMVVTDNNGFVIGYQGIVRDITDKKNAEKALIDSLNKLDKANKELLDLNSSLESKVEERTAQLLEEKEIVELNNKEIKESIQYAKRIQASILPPENRLKEGFDNFFIYYEPKDVVSGDFYWYEKTSQKPLFAVVDCTGHGVPGAFMSIIGYTQLNEIVTQHKVSEPGLILKELDRRVNIALHQNSLSTDKNSKDGMELALIAVNYKDRLIEYSGAMRPLYLIRGGELIIYKGNKFSIGGVSRRVKEFKTETIKIQKGDAFYLFSDGYPDQFGGPSGKKFMTKNVGDMLRGIAHLDMVEQKKIIVQTINDWMKNEEQVDDMLISGIKF